MSSSYTLDTRELLVRITKYTFEGLVVAIAAYLIPNKPMPLSDVFVIGLISASVLAVLDLFAPSIGQSARNGAGFGIGASLVGFGAGAGLTTPPVVR